MSDTYQAIYDAVRSKIGNGNIGEAVQDALRQASLSDYINRASTSIVEMATEHARPSAIYRPKIFPDGDQWIALYGKNLQEGIAASGNTPEEAARAFDSAWYNQKASR